MQAFKIDPPSTLDDLLAIPEDERRHELIEGNITEKGAASGEHGQAQSDLSMLLAPFRRRSGGRFPGGWWFAAEVEVYFDAANTFRPDLAGWRRERVPRLPRGTPLLVRPDWVAEILSTNKHNDLVKKKRHYHLHQIPHYWILDPAERTLTVYRWESGGYIEVLLAKRGQRVRAEPFDAITLDVGVLFGDDEDEEQEPAAAT